MWLDIILQQYDWMPKAQGNNMNKSSDKSDAPPKTNMDPKKKWLEDYLPFEMALFKVPF